MNICRDISQPAYMPLICRHNIPYGDGGYCTSDIRDARQRGKDEALTEVSEKLHIPLETIKSSLIGEKSYCDTHVYDAPKFDNEAYMAKLLIGDIPHQNNLPRGSKLCGYVEIDGKYHKCEHCEHENTIRQIIWNDEYFRQKYFETKASFFDQMPRGMLQEEYFAMKVLGFVKISSFANTPNEMIVFWYNPITYKQTDVIYPR